MLFQSTLKRKKNKKQIKRPKNNSQSLSKVIFNEQQQQLKKKISEIFEMRQQRFLKQNLCNFYGKNYPIDYKSDFGFNQRWENDNDNYGRKQGSYSFKLKFRHRWEIIAYIIVIVFNILTIWYDSLDYFINGKVPEYTNEVIYNCSILAQVIDISIKFGTHYRYVCYKSMTSLTYKNFIVLATHVLKLCLGQNIKSNGYLIVIYISVLVLLYIQTSKIYQSLRVMNHSLTNQYHYKIIDLMFTLLIIAHAMAIVLYISSKVNTDVNWIKKYGLATDKQIIFYIYSFYFAVTTIFTVGYGDVSPANPFEVLIVTLIQICGVIVFAFIINEIGFCLSSLRKKEEMLEKDLRVFEKMKGHYRLDNQLSYRVNEYLVNSYKKINILTPDQEQGVIKKLIEELRSQIIKTSLLSIAKSSVFFASRWSKNMQQAVSNKLVHILYSPNDKIYQPPKNQRIYFVKSGRIGIYAGFQRNKKHFMKTISNNLEKEVADNCYGYTAALSSRPVRLQAVASEFTSMYFIQKDKFQKVLDSIPDLQYLHQIRNKFELADTIEHFQAPMLASSKYHYHPSKLYIVNKNKKVKGSNKRSYVNRGCRKYPCKNGDEDDVQIIRVRQELRRQTNEVIESQVKLGEFRQKLKDSLLCKVISHEFFQASQIQNLDETMMRQKEKELFAYMFQSGKDYFNYYTKNNPSMILNRIQLQNCFPRSEKDTVTEISYPIKGKIIQS